jgi:hypothetical protein
MFSSDPRGIGPGPTGAVAGALGCGGVPAGAMRIGGLLRLDAPSGAAKAEMDAAKIMQINIIVIP